ncbi:glutaminyl-peptide cyclotransferase [Dyadobacter sp. CY345]|uniref:glutaminyl-peptide cyclotransferase n=1 Tax=Dyadobacter sp. CY345 TaxID=2909335 RepID=UPI001F483162|nr:glutaminyl-peptide cyclotransferase [Dyadobacter sp. CY345]MCF2445372.1 glutaminyl-peptide cyclotransferase [Dyadobacter sp. CY345]
MNTRNTHFLFILLISLAVFSCKQEKKTERNPETEQKPATAVLARTRFTIGDSIAIGFSQPVSQIEVKWNGVLVPDTKLVSDSVFVSAVSEKTGWKQLIVSGTTKSKETFADTLSVELLSDITPKELTYSVLSSYPHQKTSFTEGLEFYKGELYESTGENGKSLLLKIDLKTGATLKSVPLTDQYFGEGLTIFKDKIYQLTWTTGVGFRYNMDFTLDKTFTYYTQGWGMTHTDSSIIMGDGSNKLYYFDAEFKKTGELEVYDDKGPVLKINELEYVDGYVFANIWETDKIIQIDLSSGKVVGSMDMKKIIPAEVDQTGSSVLNGIAFQALENAFYITGKNWPTLFKIKVSGAAKKSQKTIASK